MNSLMTSKWGWVEGTHAMRDSVLNGLSDADLAYTPGGKAMSFGALFREQGEFEHSYVESLRTFTQNFDYRNTEAGLDGSVARLKTWFAALDEQMHDLLAAMSEDDLKKVVARPGGFDTPVEVQVDIYLQAILIFLGKASIYLRVMGRALPGDLEAWVA